jgi:hypothetical protein
MPLQDLDDYSASTAAAAGAGPLPQAPPAGGSAGAATGGGGEQPVIPGGPLSGLPDSGSGPDRGEQNQGAGGTSNEPLDAGVTPGGADASGPCGTAERFGPNGRCYFLQTLTAAWSDARTACQARGTGWDLTSIRSAADAAFVGGVLTVEAWIGASDAAAEGTWIWVDDGATFWLGGVDGVAPLGVYTNWNATEPNGATTTNCARALPAGPGASNPDAPWADLDCAQLRGALCEGPL